MSDPNHMHEFDPNKRGLCKQYTTNGLCHLPETAPVHMRWRWAQEQSRAQEYARVKQENQVREAAEEVDRIRKTDVLSDVASMSRRGLNEAPYGPYSPGGEIVRAATYMRLCVKSLKSYLDDHPNCTISMLPLKEFTSLIEASSVLLTNAANDGQQKYYADLLAARQAPDAPDIP